MIIGGFNAGQPTDAVNVFDVSMNTINKIASLSKNRYSHSCSAAVLEGKEYIFAAGINIY